jgi:hypothetical protein
MSRKPRSPTNWSAPPIPELPDDRHPDRFLALDEMFVEDGDQDVALSRPERVLPQLDDPAAPHGAPLRPGGRRWTGALGRDRPHRRNRGKGVQY